MDETVFPKATADMSRRRKELAPNVHDAFTAFSREVFKDGALDGQTKQLIAVAVAHVTQCPCCIEGHTKLASRSGASDEQIMEAIWVAAEMRAGGAYAHAALALRPWTPCMGRTRRTNRRSCRGRRRMSDYVKAWELLYEALREPDLDQPWLEVHGYGGAVVYRAREGVDVVAEHRARVPVRPLTNIGTIFVKGSPMCQGPE